MAQWGCVVWLNAIKTSALCFNLSEEDNMRVQELEGAVDPAKSFVFK